MNRNKLGILSTFLQGMFAAGVFLLVTLSLSAEDIVVLKSGQRLEGEIVEKTEDQVKLDMGSGTVEFDRDDIEKIITEEEQKEDKENDNSSGSDASRSNRSTEKKGEGPQPLTPEEERKVEKLARKYFDAEDDETRNELQKKLKKFDPVPRQSIESLYRPLFKKAYKGPKHDGSSPTKLPHPDYPGKIRIGGVEKGKKQPMLIGLHGGASGPGSASTASSKWSVAQSMGAVTVFPNVIKKSQSGWMNKREEQYVLAIIDFMKRSYNIDTNRIYLAGHSAGGYGSWEIGGRHADLFAGIAPCAGGMTTTGGSGKNTGIVTGIVENLRNTAAYFYHSTDDPQVPPDADQAASRRLKELQKKHGGYKHKYKEYNSIGHGPPPDGFQPIVKWIFNHRRNPNPEKVVFARSRSYKKQLYWLEVSSQTGLWTGEINGNTIKITGGTSGFTLHLNRDLIDPAKPVKVVAEGEEVFHDHVNFSVVGFVECIDRYRDPEMVYPIRLEINGE